MHILNTFHESQYKLSDGLVNFHTEDQDTTSVPHGNLQFSHQNIVKHTVHTT